MLVLFVSQEQFDLISVFFLSFEHLLYLLYLLYYTDFCLGLCWVLSCLSFEPGTFGLRTSDSSIEPRWL